MIEVHIPANLFYPELPGGSMQYFRYGPHLRESGVRLVVHTVRKPHHEEERLEIRGIEIIRYSLPEGLTLLGELEQVTERALEAIRASGNPCCLHPLGTMAASLRSIARLWRARLSGVPTCFHFMMVPVKEKRPCLQAVRHDLWIRLLLSPYRKMMMCSHVMGRAYQALAGISSKRIAVIPNGIDLDQFSPVDAGEKRRLRQKWNLPETAPVVLYVGSVISRKGVEILISAWESVITRCPDARLVIVGSTGARPTLGNDAARTESENYYVEILNQIDQLTNPSSVIFAGEVSTVQDFYRAADLFAFASRLEGLPSVVLESMACGTPCVVAPFVGLPADGEEYGTAGIHYVRSEHQPEIMAADILALIESPDRREKMGREAVEWIREHQEMSMAARRLAEVYQSLVEDE